MRHVVSEALLCIFRRRDRKESLVLQAPLDPLDHRDCQDLTAAQDPLDPWVLRVKLVPAAHRASWGLLERTDSQDLSRRRRRVISVSIASLIFDRIIRTFGHGEKGDKGERGLTTTLDGNTFPTGFIEGPAGPPGPPGPAGPPGRKDVGGGIFLSQHSRDSCSASLGGALKRPLLRRGKEKNPASGKRRFTCVCSPALSSSTDASVRTASEKKGRPCVPPCHPAAPDTLSSCRLRLEFGLLGDLFFTYFSLCLSTISRLQIASKAVDDGDPGCWNVTLPFIILPVLRVDRRRSVSLEGCT
ncbi:hypothetical protein HPB51_023488 [Rhipicephalus microplus]|uniref:Uncharacterized protein n=1 Tax=Rhipicephalus microplus TaxID=6941 RepID=A0A9J6EIW7_RHIMP|nr:hypothetical protein HPB51_023488 [Rhipicephalus microplus]